jgi:hypothetical protein
MWEWNEKQNRDLVFSSAQVQKNVCSCHNLTPSFVNIVCGMVGSDCVVDGSNV